MIYKIPSISGQFLRKIAVFRIISNMFHFIASCYTVISRSISVPNIASVIFLPLLI